MAFARAATCAGLTLWLGLAGCSCGEESPTDSPDAGQDASPDGGAAITVWDAYEAGQEAVRQSPDHLQARADALVAEADAENIFKFVRDSIVLYPDSEDGFTLNSGQAKLWGVRGALRSGTGTARDKAELLASLLTRAGFGAKLFVGDALAERLDMQSVLANQNRPTFSPGEIAIDWEAAFAGETSAPPEGIDTDGVARAALAERLSTLASPRMQPRAFNFELTRVPLVGVTIDGEEVFANPTYPDAEFGQSYVVDDRVFGGGDANPAAPGTLTLRLWAVAGGEDITLVEREFDIEDVIGRRITVQTPPEGELAETFLAPALSFQRFVPTISVSGPELDKPENLEEKTGLFSTGPTFTTSGEQFELNDSGELVGPRGAISGERDAALEARVATLEVVAEAGGFPSVALGVRALDADGKAVEGLAGAAFEVSEDGETMRAELLANAIATERVLIVFDDSGSLPAEFLNEGRTTFGKALVRDILSLRPEAEIRIASAGGSDLDYRSEWSSDLPTLDESLGYTTGAFSSSNLWTALSSAAQTTATLTVFVTDGEAIDEPTTLMKAQIKNGPPVVLLQAGMPDDDDAPALVAAANGQLFSVAMHSEAIDAVTGYLDTFDPPPYRLRYAAPLEGETTRNATVKIAERDVQANATYEAPVDANPPLVFERLYLTVARSLSESSTQQLAGAEFGAEPTLEDFQDVHAALFGATTIAVEGGPPTTAQLVDDWFAHKLSTRPLHEAAEDGSIDAILMGAEQGAMTWPASAAALSAELSGQFGDDTLTFETQPRVVLVSHIPQVGGQQEERVDISSLTRMSTAGSVEDDRTTPTLEASLELALLEAARYDQSAVELLAESELVVTDTIALAVYLSGLDISDGQKLRWRNLVNAHAGLRDFVLVPATGEPLALFSIDERTGRALAVLPNSTGGGLTFSGGPDFGPTDRFFDFFGGGAAAAGAGGLGLWIALQKAIARQLIIATTAIQTLENIDPRLIDASRAAAGDAYCDFVKYVLGNVTGPLGAALSDADAVLTMLGYSIPCQ